MMKEEAGAGFGDAAQRRALPDNTRCFRSGACAVRSVSDERASD
jgi:hypothetical protein